MIASLTGRIAAKAPTYITLDVQGVGYEVHIPLSTFYSLPDLDQPTSLTIHTHVRADAIQLFGFLTMQEKRAFVSLTGISGIGPKLALNVLSALTVPDLMSAIQNDDLEKLATVPGVGKKSAGRIVLELKGKIDQPDPRFVEGSKGSTGAGAHIHEDTRSALVNLGYRPSEVARVLDRVSGSHQEPRELKDLLRVALKELGGNQHGG